MSAAVERRRSPRWVAALLVGAAILCGIGAVNRGPLYFYDTIGYLRSASQGLDRVLGLPAAAPVSPERDPANPAPATGEEANVKWGNRSVYYGAVLAVADRLDAMALVALAQGAVAAWIVLLCWRRFGPRGAGPLGYLGLCAALVALTPLGFGVAYMMPDLFFGLLILAVPLLLFEGDAPGRWERLGLLLFLLVACLSHTALVLMLLPLLVLGIVLARLVAGQGARRVVVAGMLGAAALGVAGTWAVGRVSERIFGQPALWPPFTLARVLADGPGTLFLIEACAQDPARYVLCRYLGDLPPANADAFLWEDETHQGTLFRATNAEQRRMIREQWDVVIPAVLAHPGTQIAASLRNTLRQLSLTGVEEFRWEDRLRRQMQGLFPTQLPTLMATRVAGTSWAWWRPLNILHGTVLIASLVLVLARLGGLWRPADDRRARREAAWLLMLLAGVLLNAALSGALSEAHSRYGARVVWVIPLAAMLLLARGASRARQ